MRLRGFGTACLGVGSEDWPWRRARQLPATSFQQPAPRLHRPRIRGRSRAPLRPRLHLHRPLRRHLSLRLHRRALQQARQQPATSNPHPARRLRAQVRQVLLLQYRVRFPQRRHLHRQRPLRRGPRPRRHRHLPRKEHHHLDIGAPRRRQSQVRRKHHLLSIRNLFRLHKQTLISLIFSTISSTARKRSRSKKSRKKASRKRNNKRRKNNNPAGFATIKW